MSRIFEALRRNQGLALEGGEPAGQEAFDPAWKVATEPDAPAEPLPRPDRAALTSRLEQPRGLLRFSSEWRERLASGPHGDLGLIEQFRRLAATLHQAQQVNGLRSVMVTSAAPADGKTLTSVNLALVLAESYRYNVLLVDADLRRPSIPSVANLSDGGGLSEVLKASTEQPLALVPITARLTLLPAGQPIANSIEALTSPRMKQILDEAMNRFDWVILDAPPVGLTTDARILAQMVGGTLFVVRAGQTQFPEVSKGIDAIGREQIIGVVLNAVEEKEATYYYAAEQTAGNRQS